jgi:hypothetical protein
LIYGPGGIQVVGENNLMLPLPGNRAARVRHHLLNGVHPLAVAAFICPALRDGEKSGRFHFHIILKNNPLTHWPGLLYRLCAGAGTFP